MKLFAEGSIATQYGPYVSLVGSLKHLLFGHFQSRLLLVGVMVFRGHLGPDAAMTSTKKPHTQRWQARQDGFAAMRVAPAACTR